VTQLTPEQALGRLQDLWDSRYKRVVQADIPWEKMEDLADLYKAKTRIAKTVLERAGEVEWGGHPALGDITIAIRRGCTPEELREYTRLVDEIIDMEDEIEGRSA